VPNTSAHFCGNSTLGLQRNCAACRSGGERPPRAQRAMLQAAWAHPRRQSRSACCSPSRAGGACAAPARAPGRPRRSPPSFCAACTHRARARASADATTQAVSAEAPSGHTRCMPGSTQAQRKRRCHQWTYHPFYTCKARACSTARVWSVAPATSMRSCCPPGCASAGRDARMRTPAQCPAPAGGAMRRGAVRAHRAARAAGASSADASSEDSSDV